MKILLSADQLGDAVASYVQAKHPEYTGRKCDVRLTARVVDGETEFGAEVTIKEPARGR